MWVKIPFIHKEYKKKSSPNTIKEEHEENSINCRDKTTNKNSSSRGKNCK